MVVKLLELFCGILKVKTLFVYTEGKPMPFVDDF